jgi:CelD/BcsL family acetyltransferase involved in cellulose biosynthesis
MKFSLGSLLLFAPTFKALVYDGEFEDLPLDPDAPIPPLDRYGPEIRCVLVNSHPIETKIAQLALHKKYIRYSAAQYRRFYIDFGGSFDQYMRRFSSQRRNHFKRIMKRFAAFSGGRINWREYKLPEEMREFHRHAREISCKTYQENLSDAGMPDGEAFTDELCQLAARDAVRGYVLFDREKPIAYQYCPIQEETLILQRLGYDPEYREHAPGNILFLLIIEHAFLTGRCRQFDLGRGEYPYKETLASGSLLCADIYYFRWTFANALLIAGHSLLNAVSISGGYLLDRLHLRASLRRLARKLVRNKRAKP